MPSSAYGPYPIDFSPLGDIGASIGGAFKRNRSENRLKDAWSAATKDGVTDYNAVLGELARLGDWDSAAKVAQMKQLQEGMTPYQRESLDIEREKLQRSGATAPTVQSFYDEGGQEVKKQWNPQTGQWDQTGAPKGVMSGNQRVLQNIESGLGNLRKATDKYDDVSFESALGPLQGGDPDSLIGSGVAGAARLGGEVTNYFGGGKTPPTRVRSDIKGSTEALAAAIKPLIRSPGEGVWTDADQARLVAIVGDLPEARTKAEYKQRLNDVRDRLKANFGLDINFDAGDMPTSTPAGPGPTAPQSEAPRVDMNALQQRIQAAKASGATDEQIRRWLMEIGVQ